MKMNLIIIALVLVLVVVAVVRAMRTGDKAPPSGTPAPDFTLNSQDGKPLSLHDFRGKWVVLYFYPKDFTSGCTKEAHNFQRDLAQYEQKNAVILGVSVQDDSLVNLGVARLSARHTFLIDTNGVVRKAYLNVNAAKHSAEVLADLAELQKIPALR